MLILTRRESDKILFPSLGISVEVLRVQGNRAQLGIEAPAEVPILRHEIATLRDVEFAPSEPSRDERLRDLVFTIRSRLDATASTLNQLHRSIDASHNQSAQDLIDEMFAELKLLETEANRILEQSGIAVNSTPQALLVEDSAAERTLLEAYLDLCGFNVTTAEDGQDALDYLSMHSRPDVVLLDMMMPRVDGPTFVRTVRHDPKLIGLPIFALTGMEQEDVDIPTGPLGVNQWHVKPVNPKKLVHDVAVYLTEMKPIAVA